jgi:DNA uptake protein ComE-like DNA-binding protein
MSASNQSDAATESNTAAASVGRSGLVLIMVLVVVVLLSFVAYSFSELMLTAHKSAQIAGCQLQARALAESGGEYVRVVLSQSTEALRELGGLFDNKNRFQDQPVGDNTTANLRGRVSVFSPRIESGQTVGIRYGLENESARLNLNALAVMDSQHPGIGRQLLMALPGLTEQIADSILDWIDTDKTPREFGAEAEAYSNLNPPYSPKNGPLGTVEELLKVKGVTPKLLFGADQNRNGVIDTHEQTEAAGLANGDSDPEMNRGWAAYLTIYAKESTLQPDGAPKLDINSSDLQKLHDGLMAALNDKEQVNFVIAYRLYGPAAASLGSSQSKDPKSPDFKPKGQENPEDSDIDSVFFFKSESSHHFVAFLQTDSEENPSTNSGNPSANPNDPNSDGKPPKKHERDMVWATDLELDLTAQPKAKIENMLDLIGAQVELQEQDPEAGPVTELVRSAFPDDPSKAKDYLSKLQTRFATSPVATFPGRININQAPRAILAKLPGMDDSTVDQVIARREPEYSGRLPDQQYETWLYTEGVVKLDQMKTILPFVTVGGCVFRAQIVGYFDGSGPYHRAEIVVDTSLRPNTAKSSSLPRVLAWRDLTHLGRGIPVQTP